MRSRIFEARVDGIMEAIDKALPELRERFGESLTLKEISDTITPKKLLEESNLSSFKATCASIRGSRYEGPWIDVPRLYDEALKLKRNPLYLGEGI